MGYQHLMRKTAEAKRMGMSMPMAYCEGIKNAYNKDATVFHGDLDTFTPYVVCAANNYNLPTLPGARLCENPDPKISITIKDKAHSMDLMIAKTPTVFSITSSTCLLRMEVTHKYQLPNHGDWSLVVDAKLPKSKSRLKKESKGTFDLPAHTALNEEEKKNYMVVDVSDLSQKDEHCDKLIPRTKMKMELACENDPCTGDPIYYITTVIIYVKYPGSPCCYSQQQKMLQASIGCNIAAENMAEPAKCELQKCMDDMMRPYEAVPQKFCETHYCVRDSGYNKVKKCMNKKIKENGLFDVGNLVNPIMVTGILKKIYDGGNSFEIHHPKLYDPQVVKDLLKDRPELIETMECMYGTYFPTLAQLLSHTAGLPERFPILPSSVKGDVEEDKIRSGTEDNFEKDFIQAANAGYMKLWPPGTKFLMSEVNSVLLGMILRRMYDKDTVQEAVLQIAQIIYGMKEAMYNPMAEKVNADRIVYSPGEHQPGDRGVFGAAGGLYATTEDISNFSHEFVKKDAILPVVLMTIPLAVVSKAVPVCYGYGGVLVDCQSRPGSSIVVIGSRTENGHTAQVMIYPDYKVSVSYVTNVNPFMIPSKTCVMIPIKALEIIENCHQYERLTPCKATPVDPCAPPPVECSKPANPCERVRKAFEPCVGLSPGYMAYHTLVSKYLENTMRRNNMVCREQEFTNQVCDNKYSSVFTDNSNMRQFISFGKVPNNSYMIPIHKNFKKRAYAHAMLDPYTLYEHKQSKLRKVDTDGLPYDYIIVEEGPEASRKSISLNGTVYFDQKTLEEMLDTIENKDKEIQSSIDPILAGIDDSTDQKEVEPVGQLLPLVLGGTAGYFLGRAAARRRYRRPYYRPYYGYYAPIYKAIGTSLQKEDQIYKQNIRESSHFMNSLRDGLKPHDQFNAHLAKESLLHEDNYEDVEEEGDDIGMDELSISDEEGERIGEALGSDEDLTDDELDKPQSNQEVDLGDLKDVSSVAQRRGGGGGRGGGGRGRRRRSRRRRRQRRRLRRWLRPGRRYYGPYFNPLRYALWDPYLYTVPYGGGYIAYY